MLARKASWLVAALHGLAACSSNPGTDARAPDRRAPDAPRGADSSLAAPRLVRSATITTLAEGGGERGEIAVAKGQIAVVYRGHTDTRRWSHSLKLFDGTVEASRLVESREVVPWRATALPTDAQLVSDGESFYVAYEVADLPLQPGSVTTDYVARFDAGWHAVGGPVVGFQGPLAVKPGEERGDDPSPYLCGDKLCVMNELLHCAATDRRLALRVYDLSLKLLEGPRVLPFAPSDNFAPIFLASQVASDGKIFIAATTARGHDACQRPPGPGNCLEPVPCDDLKAYRLDASFAVEQTYPLAVKDNLYEGRPTGFKLVDGKFYLTHFEASSYDPLGKTTPASVRLKIFDAELRPLFDLEVKGGGFSGEIHPTVEIVGKRIWVAYSGYNEEVPNVAVAEYEWP